MRMDAMALQGGGNALTAPLLQNTSDDVLSDIWDWCTIKGCRSVALAGRLYLRKSPTDKFRSVLGAPARRAYWQGAIRSSHRGQPGDVQDTRKADILPAPEPVSAFWSICELWFAVLARLITDLFWHAGGGRGAGDTRRERIRGQAETLPGRFAGGSRRARMSERVALTPERRWRRGHDILRAALPDQGGMGR